MQLIRAIFLLATLSLLTLLASACEQVGGVDFGSVRLKSDGTTTTTPGGQTTPASVTIACDKACADYDFECGTQSDPCGKVLDCGKCADGKACTGSKCGCLPKSCADLGAQCGTAPDGCGGVLDCGTCANPAEGCSDNKCKCQPKGCTEQKIHCGTTPDGCAGQYACGDCGGATPTCSAGTCGAAPCTPTTCAAQGKKCGQISDGCGSILTCGNGTCTAPQACGGSGVANVCGCTPTTCVNQGKNCGSIPDNCGGALDCGACTAMGATCGGTGTANTCGCVGDGSCDAVCGTGLQHGVDNCGNTCTRSCGGGGGGGCFGRGTPVRMADGSFKAIELVEPGERVASYDPATGQTHAALVLARLAHGPETSAAGFLVRRTAAGTLRVTPNHPILIDGVRAAAETLRADSRIAAPFAKSTPASLAMHVLDVGVRSEAVGTLEHELGNGEPTFDLAIEGSGAFFAANVLVLAKQIPDTR